MSIHPRLGEAGGWPGAGPPLPALGKLASRQMLLRVAWVSPTQSTLGCPGHEELRAAQVSSTVEQSGFRPRRERGLGEVRVAWS